MLLNLLTLALKSLKNVGMYKEHTAVIGMSQLFSFKQHAQPITSTQSHLSKQQRGKKEAHATNRWTTATSNGHLEKRHVVGSRCMRMS